MKEYQIYLTLFGKEYKLKTKAENQIQAKLKAERWLIAQSQIDVFPIQHNPVQDSNSFMDFFNSIVNKK